MTIRAAESCVFSSKLWERGCSTSSGCSSKVLPCSFVFGCQDGYSPGPEVLKTLLSEIACCGAVAHFHT